MYLNEIKNKLCKEIGIKFIKYVFFFCKLELKKNTFNLFRFCNIRVILLSRNMYDDFHNNDQLNYGILVKIYPNKIGNNKIESEI